MSEADKHVEAFIREKLKLHFPNDQIFGEEGGSSLSQKMKPLAYLIIFPIIIVWNSIVFGKSWWERPNK